MDDWDWSNDFGSSDLWGDWGSSYDWSTPSWETPSYDWSAPSYDWGYSTDLWDSPSYDWSGSTDLWGWDTPSYDTGYWSDYLPSDSRSDYSTPSYESFYTPVSYEEAAYPSTWSDIQTPSYEYTDLDSSLRNIDIAEGMGEITPYQAEEFRLNVQQDLARQSALEDLQAQAGQELDAIQSQIDRQAYRDQMMSEAGSELESVQNEIARQQRRDEMMAQAGVEQAAVQDEIARMAKANLASQGTKSLLDTIQEAINPKNAVDKANQGLLAQLAKELGATGLKQAQAAAKYQASPVAGIANTAQSVLQILKALKGQNLMPTKARESSIQNIGPTAQAARPVRTLYAKGGSVHTLPASVMGGLLPLTLKIAEHMLNGRPEIEDEEESYPRGLIGGEEGGQADVVDIKAAPGEYIIDAEIVSALGDGNNANGAKKLDKMRYNVRKHKRSGGLAQIAPKAKPVEAYMKGK